MMAAHAVFLATVAIYLLTDSYYAWGIGMPAGITLSFVSVGFSLQEEYFKEAFIGITLLPVALWCFAYLTGELDWRATSRATSALISICMAPTATTLPSVHIT